MIKIIDWVVYKQCMLSDLNRDELLEYISYMTWRKVDSGGIIDEDYSSSSIVLPKKQRRQMAREAVEKLERQGRVTPENLRIVASECGYHRRHLYNFLKNERD